MPTGLNRRHRQDTLYFALEPIMIETLSEWLYYYKRSILQAWYTLGPTEYTTILVAVAVIGFIAMRKGPQAKC